MALHAWLFLFYAELVACAVVLLSAAEQWLATPYRWAFGQLAVCVGLLALPVVQYGTRMLFRPSTESKRRGYWRQCGVEVGAVVLVMALFIVNRGMIHIGGYDQSIIVNVGWMQLQGQEPGTDFRCTLPPCFFLGAKYALGWFGVRWQASLILCALVAGLTCAWCYVLLRALHIPHLASLFLAVSAQGMTTLFLCYWWYNWLANIAGVVLFLSGLVWLERPRSLGSAMSFGLALYFVVMNKPNGLPLALLFLGILALSHRHWRWLPAVLLLTASAVVVTAVVSPFNLPALLIGYREVSRVRGPQMEGLAEFWKFVREGYAEYWIAVALAMLLLVLGIVEAFAETGWRIWRHPVRVTMLVYAGALATGLVFFITNVEAHYVDLVLPAMAVGVCAARAAPELGRARPWCQWLSRPIVMLAFWLVLFSALAGLFAGWVRYRVYCIGPDYFWQPEISCWMPGTAFFGGVRSGKRLVHLVEQIEDVLEPQPDDARVFFGPCIEFAYAAFHKEPPRGFPVWWHYQSSYFEEDLGRVRDAFRHQEFDLLIFANSFYGMPEHFEDELQRWYVRGLHTRELTVYYPRRSLRNVPSPSGTALAR